MTAFRTGGASAAGGFTILASEKVIGTSISLEMGDRIARALESVEKEAHARAHGIRALEFQTLEDELHRAMVENDKLSKLVLEIEKSRKAFEQLFVDALVSTLNLTEAAPQDDREALKKRAIRLGVRWT